MLDESNGREVSIMGRWVKLMVFIGLGLWVLGIVTSQALSATYDPELVKKAKAEGKLMWYGCVPDAAAGLGSAFEKRFGIKFDLFEGACYPTLERFRMEQKANRFVTDIFCSYPDVMLTMKKEGFFTPYKSPFLAEYDPRFQVKDNFWTSVKPHAYFFTVNKRTVPDKSLWPKKWTGYLNPLSAWKNRIGIFDLDLPPLRTTSSMVSTANLVRKNGVSCSKKLPV